MMKFASEEARVQSDESLHDKKSTMCLEAYIQWFNRLTSFVTTEVLKHTQRRSRAQFIDYFLDAAEQCLLLHNFNSMAAILGTNDEKWSVISRAKFNHWTNDIVHWKQTIDHQIKEKTYFPRLSSLSLSLIVHAED